VWEDLAKYKAEGRFLDGYPDDQRTFFAPRDNVHGLLVALLDSAQHSIVVNMFGNDDDELNKIIQGKLADEKIYVQMSLTGASRPARTRSRSWPAGPTTPSAIASPSAPVRCTTRSHT
jgi:hypothetical protein